MRPALILSAALMLAACHREPRSESFFRTHPQALDAVLAACAAGEEGGRECDAASAAEAVRASQRRMELYQRSYQR